MREWLFLIALLAFSVGLKGQGFEAGFSLGLATTQVDGDTYGGYHKAGPLAGIWVERPFGHNWRGSMELRYVQKGSYRKHSREPITFYRMQLHYIEMPVLAGYRFKDKIWVEAGLGAGYLAKSKESTQLGPFLSEEQRPFRKYELSALAGLQYEYSNRLTFEVFFSYSILPIRLHQEGIVHLYSSGQFNNVLAIALRYRI